MEINENSIYHLFEPVNKPTIIAYTSNESGGN